MAMASSPNDSTTSTALLSTANLHVPSLTLPFFRPIVITPNILIQQHLQLLHKSFTSASDNCFRFLNSIASQNPFLQKLISMHSQFQSVCQQIQYGNLRKRNSLSCHSFAAVLPGNSVAGIVVANGILNFLNLYNTLLVVRLVLTWFPNAPPAIVSPLSTICDPYLNIFRGIIPPLGGTLDFSPILAFLVLNAFTSTAAALPAELPQKVASQEHPTSCTISPGLTTSQKKWIRRLQGNNEIMYAGHSQRCTF